MEITLEEKIYLKLKSHEICSTQNIQNTGQRERRPNVIVTETQLNSTLKKPLYEMIYLLAKLNIAIKDCSVRTGY